MIVEIVGPPGAGKSTIAALLDKEAPELALPLLSFAEYDALDRKIGEAAIMKKSRFARWGTLLPLCWRRPRMALSLVVLTLLHGRPLLKRSRKAQRIAAHALFTDRLNAIHPDRTCVHHDGFTQCLWSTLIDSRRLRGHGLIAALMRDYYDRVPTKRILLEVDDQSAAQRVFGRTSKGRFNRDSSPEQVAQFGRWLDYHRQLVGLLPPDPDAIRIDGSGSANDVARRVALALR